MKPNNYPKNIHIRVTEDTRELALRIAKFSKRKFSDVVREALEKGLKS
jgi:uncharacterized protein (DUF1778 family)